MRNRQINWKAIGIVVAVASAFFSVSWFVGSGVAGSTPVQHSWLWTLTAGSIATVIAGAIISVAAVGLAAAVWFLFNVFFPKKKEEEERVKQ